MNPLLDEVKQIITSLLSGLAVTQASITVSDEQGVISISIESDDDRSLVGRDNERYEAISHLIKRMLARKLGEDAKVIVDINGIRAKNVEQLKAKAMMIASRAREFKRDVEMDPMSSYERMLVHSALEGVPDIKTESIGEGRGRRLVVKYIGD